MSASFKKLNTSYGDSRVKRPREHSANDFAITWCETGGAVHSGFSGPFRMGEGSAVGGL